MFEYLIGLVGVVLTIIGALCAVAFHAGGLIGRICTRLDEFGRRLDKLDTLQSDVETIKRYLNDGGTERIKPTI